MTGIGSRASAVRLFAPRQPESPSSSTSVCGGLLVGPVLLGRVPDAPGGCGGLELHRMESGVYETCCCHYKALRKWPITVSAPCRVALT